MEIFKKLANLKSFQKNPIRQKWDNIEKMMCTTSEVTTVTPPIKHPVKTIKQEVTWNRKRESDLRLTEIKLYNLIMRELACSAVHIVLTDIEKEDLPDLADKVKPITSALHQAGIDNQHTIKLELSKIENTIQYLIEITNGAIDKKKLSNSCRQSTIHSSYYGKMNDGNISKKTCLMGELDQFNNSTVTDKTTPPPLPIHISNGVN